MRFTISGLLRAKPFDESSDPSAGDVYVGSPLLACLIAVGAGLCLAAVYLAATSESFVWVKRLLCLAAAVSAVTAGFEWHHGLRARALNQLFWVVVLLAFLAYALV